MTSIGFPTVAVRQEIIPHLCKGTFEFLKSETEKLICKAGELFHAMLQHWENGKRLLVTYITPHPLGVGLTPHC